MKKNGFTLVELLAVIVILAVILAIAIPSIAGIVESTKKSLLESDTKMILKSASLKVLEYSTFDPTTINETNISSILNIDNNNYQTLTTLIVDNKLYIVIIGKNKWAGFKACGTKESVKVVAADDEESCLIGSIIADYDATKGVNKPKLASGMTPIKWDGSTWIDTTEDDASWYNYDTTNKQWANAKTADDSMWVWIPRYIYKVSSGWHSNTTGTIDIQFSKGIDDNWNSSTIGNINTDKTAESSNGTWTNHSAFTFGSTELTGIWVAKFEATAAEGVANTSTSEWSCSTAEDNVTTKTIKSIPNVQSWRCIIINNAFINTRNMETNLVYGWGTSGDGIDTHLMKSTEWGALAYLSKSTYGQEANEIYINNNQNSITGCAGNSASAVGYNGCQNTYDTAIGQKASTTGTIYGIYDMSGGSWEYIAAYVNNANSSLGQGSSITSAASQYKDAYAVGTTDDQVNDYTSAINQKGDAIYETSNSYTGNNSWFNDFSSMPSASYPWFIRGCTFNHDFRAGVFVFAGSMGTVAGYTSFRPVLLVNVGL